MKLYRKIFIISTLFLFLSCAVNKTLTNAERDGSSFQKAIKVNSIPEEYQYVKKICPTCQFVMQSLAFHKNKPYDILEYKNPDGKTVSYYFDISNFYGKGIF